MALGASDTTEFDKMMGALGMLSGSKAGAQKAFDAASAMYAPVEDANPWEASLRFFLEMGKQASQPGATVLGSAVGSGLVPLDYLTAKKKEKRDRDQKVASTAFSLAPSLKPKVTKATYSDPKFYMVSKADGKGGFTTPVETPLTAKDFAEMRPQIEAGSVRVTSLPKAGTKFTKRTLYKPDGSTIDVYSDVQEQNAISAGYGRVKADDFKSVTLYKNGSSVEARSQAEFDTLTSQAGGGWSTIKPAAQSTAQYKRTVYKDGKELTVYSEEDYKTATSEEGGWSPEKPADAGPQGSASERMTNRVFGFVDTFIGNDGKVDSRQLAQFISDVKDMAEPETLTFVEDGVAKTATNPGKDAYDIIEQAYGKTVADAIRDIAIQTVASDGGDGGDGDGDGDEKPLLQTVVIAGKEYTVFSSKDPSIPKEAVQGIVDSNGGMIDVKIASDILFKDGKYNRLAAIASNVLPGGGAGPSGTLTGDSRTAYQAMKRSIELLLRARSGAAVPPAEVDNYMALYYPSTLDNDEQAKNKLNVLAQYFSDTNRLLSQGKLNEGRGTYDRNKHGIPLDSSVSSQAETAPEAVTVVDEWTLNGVKFKQLSDGRTIEEAE